MSCTDEVFGKGSAELCQFGGSGAAAASLWNALPGPNSLADIEQAVGDMRAGITIKPVLLM